MKRPFRWIAALILIPLLLFVIALLLHHRLSITSPSGAAVAVVEGWIPPDLMPLVKKEIDRRGYDKVYITGTLRPFTYWLKADEWITIAPQEPLKGELKIAVAGLPGSGFVVIADRDTIMRNTVDMGPIELSARIGIPINDLLIQPLPNGSPADVHVLFVQRLEIDDRNVHALNTTIDLHNTKGARNSGWPTYAHYGAELLRQEGLGAEPVPANAIAKGRTAGNAEAFAAKAKADAIGAVDVISLGVHARRSWGEYKEACGPDVKVGVVSIEDPAAPGESWWRTKKGWIGLMKEMLGAI